MKQDISEGSLTTEEVMRHIKSKYGVDYSTRKVMSILKSFKMHPTKLHNYKRTANANDILKNLDNIFIETSIIVFIDPSLPQTTSNSVRFWSFKKPEIFRNTDRYKANVFGFYSLNRTNVVYFPKNSKKESIISFLKKDQGKKSIKKDYNLR
ncbi:MAG: hypothetical protein QXJ93_02045 [Candidatus Rehaiarchaeum fermentans]|nr:hypothetical protein [Candidatus Rehaiarchaeum fermentans]